MSHFHILRKSNFMLEKIFFLLKKCIYFITYRIEHPADALNPYILIILYKQKALCVFFSLITKSILFCDRK